MAKWFVRAERGNATHDQQCFDQRETVIKIGGIEKRLPFKPAWEVAAGVKKSLIAHGWSNVRVVRVDPAPSCMTITKTIELERDRALMRITVELREGHPTLSDGFSVTADLYEPRKTQTGRQRYEIGRDIDAGGAMHEKILRWAPELAPLVAVHLADPDGTPMHAVANGWYFYSGKAREWEEARNESWHNREGLTDHERAARALHIPPADLPEGMDKEQFEAFAESLRTRWAEQARAARELLEML